MAGWHTVKQGETVSSIADCYGFSDYKTVYNRSENTEFRMKRRNPDIIFPEDQIFIPDLEPESFSCVTDRLHKFVLSSQNKVLRIRLQDCNGRPFSRTPYQIHIEFTVLTGTTDDQGVLEKRVPVQARHGTLKIDSHEWTLNIGELNPIDDTADRGASGIQQRLRNLGFAPGPIDGVVGPQTRLAIRGFQEKHPPLPVDGDCTPETISRLMKEHGS